MFFKEQHDAVDRLWKMVTQFNMVENIRFVLAHKAPALHPGIGEVSFSLLAEKQDAAFRWNQAFLIMDQESQGQQIVFAKVASIPEQGLQRRQIQIVDRQTGHGQFIKGNAFNRTVQLGDQFPVSLTIRRAEPHIDTVLQAFSLQPMWT